MERADEPDRGGGQSRAVQTDTVLEIEDLHTRFLSREGLVRAVDGVSCRLDRGETVGVVGESGCGKTVMGLSILRLIRDPPGKIVQGAIRFKGTNLLDLTQSQMQQIRGNEISMIFQEPMTSLNPVLTVGHQIGEALIRHQGLSKRDALDRAVEMLLLVQISDARRRVHEYPHQMSGGMRQRVMIAMALSCNPRVLIADEPTTALDVTIQAQILDLMRALREKLGTATILITHDMGIIAENTERVMVMYAGKKVEEAAVEELFSTPCHPYTKGLLASIPRLGAATKSDAGRARLNQIEGIVPSLHDLPKGCNFAPRCSYATDRCREEYPPLQDKRPGHWAACWHTDRLLREGA